MNSTATDFVFEHAPASWHLLVVVAAITLVAWFAWKRYGPTANGFVGIFARCCRVAAMVALVLLIAGPAWRTTTTTILPGRILVAIDRSASMNRSDGTLAVPRIEAASALARALSDRPDSQPLAIEYRGIGGTLGGIDGEKLRTNRLTASGTSSAIGDDLARLVADIRPDGLILVSDGRVTTGSGLAALPSAWRGRDMAVSVLATGSETVEPELIIDEVQVNRAVALGEREPVVVRLSSRALAAGPITVSVLVDGEQPITTTVAAPTSDLATMATSEVRLEANFSREGSAKVRVIAEHGNSNDKRRAELDMGVSVNERKLRVLILENRPRFETRYLREAFKRDKTITVHTYLAEGRWRRWGEGSDSDVGPAHLPLSPAELREYDVVVIGDIGPDALRESDLNNIETAVRSNAVGLVWLPGETGAIAGFANTKLGALIPVELPDAQTISRGYLGGGGHRTNRTPAAEQLGLLDAGDADWSRLPVLLGASPVLSTKPTAEVLVEDQLRAPLVVSRTYGVGRALFIAVDDTWRWRRNVGDLYLHRFHSQLLRFVASGRRLGNHAWRLFANPRRAISGEPLSLNLTPIGGRPESRPDSVTVRLTAAGGQEQLLRLNNESDGFALRVPAPAPGTWTLEVASGIDSRTVDSDQLVVLPPSDELRDPRIDRAALTALVAGSGGQYHTDAAKLVAELPDLSRAESMSTITGWWDTMWALMVIVTLFACDWAIRRLNRLP
jgi:uncharacterized membrane protein